MSAVDVTILFIIVDLVRDICRENKEGNFMSSIPRTVDGVVLESNDERDAVSYTHLTLPTNREV